MGDGKVRFIPEKIDPDKFRAMCTIAGGEKIDDLDQIAPVVPDDTPAAPPPGRRRRTRGRTLRMRPSPTARQGACPPRNTACQGAAATRPTCRRSSPEAAVPVQTPAGGHHEIQQ